MDVTTECIVCKGYSKKGVTILEKFICCECESTIVNTDINDGSYQKYKDDIKMNILPDIILGLAIK